MSAFNPDWSRAPMLVSLFQTAAEAVKGSTAQDFESQLVTLSFHVKPGPKPFKQTLAQFVNEETLGVKDASMYGISVYTADYTFVVDGSAIVQGGAFIKLIRNFPADKRFEEMAKILFSDEQVVLGRLGLRLQ